LRIVNHKRVNPRQLWWERQRQCRSGQRLGRNKPQKRNIQRNSRRNLPVTRPSAEPASVARRTKRAARLHDCACRRQVRFGPVAFWIAVGTVVIMAGWSITAATYLAFATMCCVR